MGYLYGCENTEKFGRRMDCVATLAVKGRRQMLPGRATIAEDRLEVSHYALFSALVPRIGERIFVAWRPAMFRIHNSKAM